jgi:putative membrane protein
MRKKLYFATAMLFLASGLVLAQSQTQPSSSTSTQPMKQDNARVNNADQRFVTEAAEAGKAEVAHGQLAAERASNPEVKTFAQRMVDDHTKANQELMQLASSKSITLSDSKANKTSPPTNNAGTTDEQRQLKGKHREMQDQLMKLSGAEFDREYIRQQVKDHEKAVALFERQANSGSDAELKAFAAKTLPTLREHHQMVRDLATKVGASDAKSMRDSNNSSSRPKQ